MRVSPFPSAAAWLALAPLLSAQTFVTGKVIKAPSPACDPTATHALECTDVLLKSSSVSLAAWENSYVDLNGALATLGSCNTITVAAVTAAKHTHTVTASNLFKVGTSVIFKGSCPQSSVVALAISGKTAVLPAGGLGTLLVDPFAQILLGPAPAPLGSWAVDLRIPYDVALVGQRIWSQGAWLDTTPAASLVNAACFLVTTPPQDFTIAELFASEAQLDRDRSSGTWNSGSGSFGILGGDGLHGDFVPADGQFQQPSTYIWSTTNQPITNPLLPNVTPALSPVTNGVFRFANFNLPKGVIVDFRGSIPPRIYVRGSMTIAGTIRLNGVDITSVPTASATGQLGSAGGPGGGSGGQGGDKGNGTTGGGNFNGRPGADVVLTAGHAYAAAAVGTGGLGSPQYPAAGLNSAVTYLVQGSICGQTPGGGGGGGSWATGAAGAATSSPSVPQELGAGGAGGIAFSPFPFPVPGKSTFDHFLIGGSGGGGGGSHPFFAIKSSPIVWWSGGGGSGGGGALGLRVGRDLMVTSDGAIQCKGGNGVLYTTGYSQIGPPAPGGGGAGGAVVMQVAGAFTQAGRIDTSGGVGSSWNLAIIGVSKNNGGTGSPGVVRLEMPALPAPGVLGTTVPAAAAQNVDILREVDATTGFQSKWYSTRISPVTPTFLWYQVDAQSGTTPVVFSDDPARGVFAGYGQNQAVTVLFQGAVVDGVTGLPQPGTERPWRQYVGRFGTTGNLDTDGASGFRFLVLINRAIATNLTIKKVTVGYRA